MSDPTKRFSNRVADYVSYRPHYPAAILGVLSERLGLAGDWRVADIGSGTGISSERFLELGCSVSAVEPNREMREAAEAWLGSRPNFHSHDGRAEATGLESASIDLWVAGQAFHWFDRPAARAEALRALRPPKRALVMYNDWEAEDSPFLSDYAALQARRMPAKAEADHRKLQKGDFDLFFGSGAWEELTLPNGQSFDLEGLRGRLLSASYAPKPGEAGYDETMAELASIFARHSRQGAVAFPYRTVLLFGTMEA
jgi:SAM-dependent methyltransferase